MLSNQEYENCQGNICPVCEGSEIESMGGMEVDGGNAWQEVRCNDCDARWQDIYHLVGFDPREASTKTQLQLEVLRATHRKSS